MYARVAVNNSAAIVVSVEALKRGADPFQLAVLESSNKGMDTAAKPASNPAAPLTI